MKSREVSKELQFIKDFSKISINSICNDLKIDKSNLYRNSCSRKNEKIVYNELIKKIYFILKKIDKKQYKD